MGCAAKPCWTSPCPQTPSLLSTEAVAVVDAVRSTAADARERTTTGRHERCMRGGLCGLLLHQLRDELLAVSVRRANVKGLEH